MAVNMDAILRVTAKGDARGLNDVRTGLLSIQSAGRVAQTALVGMGAGLAGALGIAGGGAIMAKIFGDTATLEKQNKSLEVLLGSAEKASKIVGELQAYGSVTPFEATDLIETAKKLTAFGVEGERVVEVTKTLGDVAGATGADLNELATVYGQVVAKGKLQTEELLQFQERGVGIQGELQKMYQMTGGELAAAITKGKISAQAVEVAFQRLTSAGGKYANGAIAQSDTLFGKMSTLQDTITQLSQRIGKELEPITKSAIDSLIKFGEGLVNVFDQAKEPIRQTVETLRFLGGALNIIKDVLVGMQPGLVILNGIFQAISGQSGKVAKDANDTATGYSNVAKEVAKTPPLLGEAATKASEAKAAQEAFKLAVDQSNFSYDLLKATIQATFQEVELMNELSAAEYDANISINNSAISILRTKMQLTDNEQEKLALTEEIMKLEIANAGFQKKATEAQIIQEINVADLKRRQLWTDLRRVEAALALAQAEGRATQEMRQALEMAKRAANSADEELRFTKQIAEQKERAADAAYDAAVFNARAGLQIAQQEAANRERTRQQQAQQRREQEQEQARREAQQATARNSRTIGSSGGGGGGGGGGGYAPAFFTPSPMPSLASSSSGGGGGGGGGATSSIALFPGSNQRRGGKGGGGRSITVNTGPIMQMPDGSQWISRADFERGLAAVTDDVLNIVASPAGRMALGGA